MIASSLYSEGQTLNRLVTSKEAIKSSVKFIFLFRRQPLINCARLVDIAPSTVALQELGVVSWIQLQQFAPRSHLTPALITIERESQYMEAHKEFRHDNRAYLGQLRGNETNIERVSMVYHLDRLTVGNRHTCFGSFVR